MNEVYTVKSIQLLCKIISFQINKLLINYFLLMESKKMKNFFACIIFFILFTCISIAQSNVATTSQTGQFNEAFVEQLGSTNIAEIVSTGNYNLDNSNNSHVFKVPHTSLKYLGPMLAKGITQQGDLNEAHITQSFNNGTAGIGQSGNHDLSTIIQDDPSHTAGSNHSAWVDQLNGNYNKSYQSQSGLGEISYIRQYGSRNNIHMEQYDYASNEAVQKGNYNNLTQYQIGTTAPVDGVWNTANAYQIGSRNYAVQNQDGNSNNSLITSRGKYNGVLGDEIKTDQVGNSNSASIEEGLLGVVNYSLASVNQSGNLQTATVSQEAGDYNEARINQTSLSNTAHVYQNGPSNYSIVTQH